jgi:lysozyme
VNALRSHGITDDFALLGVRGYYLYSMGAAGVNDRNIYDDAIMLVTPTAYVTFNANTDPGAFRTGIANLKPGVWRYKVGTHNISKPPEQRYTALVQAAPVTVVRDGQGEQTGWFGINIHRGGYTRTSSLGCQTIPPSQWGAFIALVKEEMRRHGRPEIPYVLMENG